MFSKKHLFRFNISVEYNNQAFADGLGAQALRLVGIFSIAQHYRLRYVHNDLRFDHPDELLGPNYSIENYQKALKEISTLLELPSSSKSRRKKKTYVDMKSITRKTLFKMIFKSLFSKSEIVIKLQLPQGITDCKPDILEHGASIVRKNLNKMYETRQNSIVIHVRTGRWTIKTKRFNSLPQLMPNYYRNVLNSLGYSDIPLTFHTDLIPEDLKGRNDSARVDIFVDFFKEYAELNRVKFCHYAPIMSVVRDMAHAKVLIMSNSALSYFAGLLNQGTVIWPPIHGHAKLNRWLEGPMLSDNFMTFVDSTPSSLKNNLDHRIFRSTFEKS